MTEKPTTTYRTVDLFAGCGGLSRGLERTGRFSSEFAVEVESHAARAYEANLRNSEGTPTSVFADDVWKLANDREWLWKEMKGCGIEAPGDVDLVVGGPPCQGFSRNGVRKYEPESGVRFYDEPRNHLFKAFLTFVEELQPRVVLIENVREFLTAKKGKFVEEIQAGLSEMGYESVVTKLSAADFGVPQVRNRAFILAARRGTPLNIPSPTHADGEPSLLQRPYVTVGEAIGDLPTPTYNHSDSPLQYLSPPMSDFAQAMRSKSGAVPNHVARKLSAKSLARVQAVGTGRMRDIADESLKTRSFYGSAYGRLDADKPALTITTWVYHVGSGRFAHPSEDRAITMREAARLQSFDDDFVFPPLINPVSQMIGNAVPPGLAEAWGRSIAAMLDG